MSKIYVIASKAKQSSMVSWIASLMLAMTIMLFSTSAYADDTALVQKVETYLNDISTLTADFAQVDSDGNASGGKFTLKRPGKFKWEYDQRQPILIISDGKQLVYYDKLMKEASYVSVENSLASFLARKDIKLSGDVKLISIEDKDGITRAKVVQRGKPDQGKLTMIFTDMKISGLEVEDANGYLTKIAFSNLQTSAEIADRNFIFHDPKYSKNAWDKN